MPSAQEAFRRQAMNDLSAYEAVLTLNLPECHGLCLLQASAEKLGKAMRRAAGQAGADAKVHPAIVKALRMLRNWRHAAEVLQGSRYEHWQFTIDRLLPLADAVERLTPAIAGAGENTEYPWQNPSLPGEWMVPAEHAFAVTRRLKAKEGAQLIALLRRIGDRFDELFI